MDAHELRELQRPLKQGYRDDPATAMVTAHAHGRIDLRGVSCHLSTGSG